MTLLILKKAVSRNVRDDATDPKGLIEPTSCASSREQLPLFTP